MRVWVWKCGVCGYVDVWGVCRDHAGTAGAAAASSAQKSMGFVFFKVWMTCQRPLALIRKQADA